MTIILEPRSGITFPDGSYQNSGMSANANSSITIPSGTTVQRPSSPNGCAIRFNTSDKTYEYYNPNISLWVKF